MPIKHVIVPTPITLVEPTTKEPLKNDKGEIRPESLKDFVVKLLFNPNWAENYKAIKSASAIDKAFSSKGPVVQVAEEDWKRLKDCLENPKGGYGYHTAVLPQLLPFFEAILHASDKEKPE
jgi:hypothetical protein